MSRAGKNGGEGGPQEISQYDEGNAGPVLGRFGKADFSGVEEVPLVYDRKQTERE